MKVIRNNSVFPKYKHDSIPDCKIWHPTEYTAKSDYLVTVIDKTGEERFIALDKDILNENVGYFKARVIYVT